MPLTPAQEEAYARFRPRELALAAFEIAHPGLAAPIRVMRGLPVGLATVSLPPAQGQSPVAWTGLAFGVQLVGQQAREGPQEGRVTLDGVSGLLRPSVEAMAATGEPASATYLDYLIPMTPSGAPDWPAVTGPVQRIGGLIIDSVEMTATTAAARLRMRDYGLQNVPRRIFNRELYPALQGMA